MWKQTSCYGILHTKIGTQNVYQKGLVYAMRQQWPSPASNMCGPPTLRSALYLWCLTVLDGLARN
jgi:hypothetical protein